jgi:hypothetical protein
VKDAILAINKIYESNSRNFELRSLRFALKIMEDNFDKLKIEYREQLEEKLTNWGCDSKCLIAMSDSELTKIVVEELKKILPPKERLNELKALRDKRIAHHESINETKIPSVLWKQIDDLLEIAKKVVGVIGNHYLGILFEINGEYSLTSDTSKTSLSLLRLLRKAEILS